MEKSWENFWTTGKVEDYLSYRNRLGGENEEQQKRSDRQQRTESVRNEKEEGWKGLR